MSIFQLGPRQNPSYVELGEAPLLKNPLYENILILCAQCAQMGRWFCAYRVCANSRTHETCAEQLIPLKGQTVCPSTEISCRKVSTAENRGDTV